MFGFNGEFDLSQVFSCHNWAVPPVVWNDGNDYFDLDVARLEFAQVNGWAHSWPYKRDIGYVTSSVPVMPIRVTVTGLPVEGPAITNHPQCLVVLAGSNVTFTVAADGTAPLAYQWRFALTNIAGATTNSYTRMNAQPADAGSYSVIVTNSGGSITSSTATLTVIVPPTIVTQPLPQTVSQGANATFTVAADGTAPFAYQWRFNASTLSGATARHP